MIVLKDAMKTYRIGDIVINAANKINMEVRPKDFAVVTGRSGSGKTTLLCMIGGLTKPTSGSVFIEEADIWTLSDEKLSDLRRRKIGFIFQFASLIPTLTVLDNLRLATAFGEVNYDISQRAAELLHLVGLSERVNAYPMQLSGGEQRRVAIARALMNRPEIILADEPTGDLDDQTEKEIMELFREIHAGGPTVVLVTHNPELAYYATRSFRMAKGTIVELQKPA